MKMIIKLMCLFGAITALAVNAQTPPTGKQVSAAVSVKELQEQNAKLAKELHEAQTKLKLVYASAASAAITGSLVATLLVPQAPKAPPSLNIPIKPIKPTPFPGNDFPIVAH